MSTIKFNFFRFSWKFIFIGQFLFCSFLLSFIYYVIIFLFIILIVLFFYNRSLRWVALRRSHFQCGKCEGRRSQSSAARTPSLALPPRWARKEFFVVVCATLLTFVCMLRYSEWNVGPIWFLDSSVLIVVCWADLGLGFFSTYTATLRQFSFWTLRYLYCYSMPI